MSQTLTEIATNLSKPLVTKKTVTKETKRIEPKEIEETKPVPKVQLIYAFNGTGKTRLSRELKGIIAPKSDGDEEGETRKKILYYNAHTEDLFRWDNDLEFDAEPKLEIKPNSFTDWIINEQGDVNIIGNFQRYTDKNIIPNFIPKEEVRKDKEGRNVKVVTYPEVVFTALNTIPENTKDSDIEIDENNLVVRGKDQNIKISKGEESNFIWSIFYTLLDQVIEILNDAPEDRETNQFDHLEYVFIDDPVSSLDENHLIELAVDLAALVKRSAYNDAKGIRFVITTHSPLFYNVLWNEFNNDLSKKQPDGSHKKIYKCKQSARYQLVKNPDGTFTLKNSNDHPFSYHLFLLSELKEAISTGQIKKYHFSFLRNILEKTATFLGHNRWEDLLEKTAEGAPNPFASRIMNLSSHSAHAGEEVSDVEDKDKEKLGKLVKYLTKTYGFSKQEA
jgi:wobble nucleotide-excising tRNase